MDYDFRNIAGPPYDSQIPMYKPTTSSSSSNPMYGPPSLYPRIGQPGHSINPPVGRTSSYQQTSSPSSSSGFGIRVAIKPEYRITAPPQLSPQVGDIPRSTFQFDFEFERKILAEAEKENQNWGRLGLENLPSKSAESTSSSGSATDPIVSKYIASGLSREAVPLAVANYGDNPTKVREFVNGYTLLREMGFSSTNVGEALLMYENDTDKAIAHFLNSSS
uniref:Putative Ubiquitin-associated 1 n=1 Tax=Davidia involucrata TaxID=16924 RepID=A0A5B6ZLW0_DAVIN